MDQECISFRGYEIRVVSLNTAIIGSGAAAFCAADRLWHYGQTEIALVTEDIGTGTSRNTGSDKQTYYKLSLADGQADSVHALAQVLYSGGAVDGDHALCEAALSAPCFFNLVELGVPFPQNRYGEFVGYKTDHDPNRRGTSVGPYTSRVMTECLEKSVRGKGIEIFDRLQVVRIFTRDGQLQGFLCVDKNAPDPSHCFVLFNCKNLVFATGGPAGIYRNSVYPKGHYGANGLAFEAGVRGKNLTEWQFGLASIDPRWNVSGTYMQVLPAFYSTDAQGGDAREFLSDFYEDRYTMLSQIFLKGYQWPFDVRRLPQGSSMIDLLVFTESVYKGRRIFLDFRHNPGHEPIDFARLSADARDYLERAGACFGAPIDRLRHMNTPAVNLYLDKGVDLSTSRLEIKLCAQHNNGGLDIDHWWQTNVEGFFAAGEAAASHGVYRPGGSALNAGQVGATRAARFISEKRKGAPPPADLFVREIREGLEGCIEMAEHAMAAGVQEQDSLWDKLADKMDKAGGPVRERGLLNDTLDEIRQLLEQFPKCVGAAESAESLAWLFRVRDTALCQFVYLSAMADYIRRGGKSRGSALYHDPEGLLPHDSLPESFRYAPADQGRADQVQIASFGLPDCSFTWRKTREIPQEDNFFENVWRQYRIDENVE